ncbi:MAG: helix-turn-helix domain-containing protein [bacterium]|nr:helix-turn-helix domain-containing protein [bacterium]
MKKTLKEQAIILRKTGLIYSDISKQLHVPISTLCDWLHNEVNIPYKAVYRLTPDRLKSLQKEWKTCKSKRIEREKIINKSTKNDIYKANLNQSHLWIMGIMLYWGEGAKAKKNNISQCVCFANQDPFMIKIFLLWLKKCIDIFDSDIKFQIYIHENYKLNTESIKSYWQQITGFSASKFDKIYFKKNNLNTKRKNTGNNYYGLLRVNVKRSTNLNRKISGWILGICNNWGVV